MNIRWPEPAIVKILALFLFALLVARDAAAAPADAVIPDDAAVIPDDGVREMRFRVMLDDREIGFHRYELRRNGDTRIVNSRAEFDVEFLFFNAYSYRHTLSAVWDGLCLESLEASTDANGKKLSVSGDRREETFVVDRGDDVARLPDCVMNFAYWDPRILEQPKLLNPQTGEYVDIQVEALEDDDVDVGDRTRAANGYRITAKDMRIDIWYAKEDQQWLALESLAKGGRTIRYELT